MSETYISADLRRVVTGRAAGLCEYCLIHEEDTFFGCEVDHIISEKHGGPTEAANLAYACLFCNRRKGSDIGSIIWRTGGFCRFYNPRIDRWADHFRLDGHSITPLTEIGEVTERILGFNDGDRLLERQVLRAAGRYPTPAALKRIGAITT
jgi:hypothetical protein